MIHKTFKQKITGSRGIDYGMSDHDHTGTARSVKPRVIFGNPDETKIIVNGIKSPNKYSSGVLSFREENIPEKNKIEIIIEHQHIMYPGIDPSELSWLYIEHRDKGFLELHWWVANVNLKSNKAIKPYCAFVDSKRLRIWVQTVNDRFDLNDPNDPKYWRLTAPPSHDLPARERFLAAKMLNNCEIAAKEYSINSREEIRSLLLQGGFEASFQGRQTLSIRHPKFGKSLKISGKMFDAKWAGILKNEEINKISELFKLNRLSRLIENCEALKNLVQSRAEYNAKRYGEKSYQFKFILDRAAAVANEIKNKNHAKINKLETGLAPICECPDQKSDPLFIETKALQEQQIEDLDFQII